MQIKKKQIVQLWTVILNDISRLNDVIDLSTDPALKYALPPSILVLSLYKEDIYKVLNVCPFDYTAVVASWKIERSYTSGVFFTSSKGISFTTCFRVYNLFPAFNLNFFHFAWLTVTDEDSISKIRIRAIILI